MSIDFSYNRRARSSSGRLLRNNPWCEPILQPRRSVPRVVNPVGNIRIGRRGHVRQPIASHAYRDGESDQSGSDGEARHKDPIVPQRSNCSRNSPEDGMNPGLKDRMRSPSVLVMLLLPPHRWNAYWQAWNLCTPCPPVVLQTTFPSDGTTGLIGVVDGARRR